MKKGEVYRDSFENEKYFKDLSKFILKWINKQCGIEIEEVIVHTRSVYNKIEKKDLIAIRYRMKNLQNVYAIQNFNDVEDNLEDHLTLIRLLKDFNVKIGAIRIKQICPNKDYFIIESCFIREDFLKRDLFRSLAIVSKFNL